MLGRNELQLRCTYDLPITFESARQDASRLQAFEDDVLRWEVVHVVLEGGCLTLFIECHDNDRRTVTSAQCGLLQELIMSSGGKSILDRIQL